MSAQAELLERLIALTDSAVIASLIRAVEIIIENQKGYISFSEAALQMQHKARVATEVAHDSGLTLPLEQRINRRG